ncbi:YjzD family protein [Lacticaseibacillus pantheris]|uniref:DUF2929 domain-containing protein n=1 Tax=Lacticaseibacillus pantheris DSM 15945 = JCM 12539 = NBRC 106106 TaxID=1423783 RepID=A0A0R1TW09_9LACO|nr:YjzD family protein [Lacticaseibacillus pantheris]KRL85529.1 hypothetical protein FC50_GL001695 [Lacticaseibacillus pantheris DSM 15945 = JCM 12539 = NBRC 106106]WKF85459.1 YjzD family protein [Lacticaseibacillus pantheris]
MRFVTAIFWGVIYGEITGFLAASLTSSTFQPVQSLIISAVFVVLLVFLPPLMQHFSGTTKSTNK